MVKDYSYIEYFYKAMKNYTNVNKKADVYHNIISNEAHRDYHTPSVRHINHLIQIDEKPNLELREPRCEIYKISLSFQPRRKS